MPNPGAHSKGVVYLVGAGPGDRELMTVGCMVRLQQADLVLYDYLVNPLILEYAQQAECICLGRHGYGRIWSQEEINARMIEAAHAGQTVVRLKSGDPMLFGRAGEELAALAAAGVRVEIEPGITAALAAGSYAGIPLTHRDCASAVAIITGQEQPDKDGPGLDYAALARFPGTLVVYMGVTTARRWSAALIEGGKPAETPAALVRRCSWPDQEVIRCTLATIPDEIERRHLRPPVLAIVGQVAALAPIADWFSQRPLFGQRVLVTRSAHRGDELIGWLGRMGAECLVQPAIHISDPPDWQPVDDAIGRLDSFDWVVFSSANGVEYFLNRVRHLGKDARAFGRANLAAIGPGTAKALAWRELEADLQPEEYRAEALAAALAVNAKGKKFLLLRASRGREVLAEQLTTAGGLVEQVVVYSSTDVTTPDPEIVERLASGGIDWITVTSSAIARSLPVMFGDRLKGARLVSISPVTSQTLRELGFPPAAEAKEYTLLGVAQAIVDAVARQT